MFTETLRNDHQEGDAQLAAAESAVASGDWTAAAAAHATFANAIEHHFCGEEQALFPALEAAMGEGFGPTRVMRSEHSQLRAMLQDLSQAIVARDDATYYAQADALRIMIRQHNLKEETILYPMADRALASQQDALLAAMKACAAPTERT